jgi:hypothetical protein
MADNYKILSQKQNISLNPSGTGFVDVWEITYQVTAGPSKGTTATVEVPDNDHNADYVKQAIEDKITALDAISGL